MEGNIKTGTVWRISEMTYFSGHMHFYVLRQLWI